MRKIPLEVFVTTDKQPIYGTTFDDDGRGGYASKLPFNAYGAPSMPARCPLPAARCPRPAARGPLRAARCALPAVLIRDSC